MRTYFEILEDTYLGYRLPPWTEAHDRRLIETEEDQKVRRCVVISLETEPRRAASGIDVWPCDHFLDAFWGDGLGL